MEAVLLYSAPDEQYLDHILRCKEKLEIIFPLFETTITRVLQQNNLKDSLLKMVLFHDLGKLTKKWQEQLISNKALPSHSSVGAAYLWKILPDGIKEPISFAVAIHHTDRGLLGDNIERPDVQAIMDGIVDSNGNIIWYEKTYKLKEELFPNNAKNLTVNDLKAMARGLRMWAKGCRILEQHKRRMQTTLVHHILKLCDISAAIVRKEYQKKNNDDYYGGWLMVENIKNYIDTINKRTKL